MMPAACGLVHLLAVSAAFSPTFPSGYYSVSSLFTQARSTLSLRQGPEYSAAARAEARAAKASAAQAHTALSDGNPVTHASLPGDPERQFEAAAACTSPIVEASRIKAAIDVCESPEELALLEQTVKGLELIQKLEKRAADGSEKGIGNGL